MTTETEEILDRVRRIETRLCSYIVAEGGAVNSAKPKWDARYGHVVIAGLDVRVSECLSAAPQGVKQVVVANSRGVQVATLFRELP